MASTQIHTDTDESYVATYHDTVDGRLARADITLRRRLENGVGLWEAEIDGTVVSAPGGPADLPDEIAAKLVAPLRNADVVEVARMRKGDDVALLEGQHVLRHYDDEQSALDDVAERARAPKKRDPAVNHVRAYLGAQVAAIERSDPRLRVGDDAEAVHDLRVAVRRSRTVLKLAADAFEREWVERLDVELRWLATELGELRDLDVLLEHLRADGAGRTTETAPVVARLEGERGAARSRAAAALANRRYLALLDELHVAADHPPVHEAGGSLITLAAEQFRKLRRTVGAFGATPTDEELHRARIRAKKARYAAELARPVAGKRAAKFVDAAKRFQDVVGSHQDAVVAERRLRAFADDPEAAFEAGRLAERQTQRRRAARADLAKAWRRVERRGRKAWT